MLTGLNLPLLIGQVLDMTLLFMYMHNEIRIRLKVCALLSFVTLDIQSHESGLGKGIVPHHMPQ